MKKIINLQQAEAISKELKSKNRKLVITGGCFDILHLGHVKLFEQSKKQGDILMILLENDTSVKKLKGKDRPINTQNERAMVLSSISFIDYVVTLPYMNGNSAYDLLIKKIKPDVITTTKKDPQGIHNERQAKLVNAKVVYVLKKIKHKSTTRLAKIIFDNF